MFYIELLIDKTRFSIGLEEDEIQHSESIQRYTSVLIYYTPLLLTS